MFNFFNKLIKWCREKTRGRVWILCDVKEIVDWINDKQNPLGPLGDLIKACREEFKRDEGIRISYIPREHNEMADGLARIAASKGCDWIEFEGPREGS